LAFVATSAIDSALAWVGKAWAKARAPVESNLDNYYEIENSISCDI
jgi:hypothetical protein